MMTQKSRNLNQYFCDGKNCDGHTEEITEYHPPKGWSMFAVYTGNYGGSADTMHFCPMCTMDIKELKPMDPKKT
jgi:hypothetical protein